MIEPLLRGDALLEDIRAAARQRDCFHLWWLGQSGFLLHWQQRFVLFDPYLSDSLTRKYAGTDKPHTRMTRLAIEPGRLDFVDVVTSTHNHTDHLDAETLGPLLSVNPQMTILVPRANREFAAERLAIPPERLTPTDVDGRQQAAGFTFTAVPAGHEELEQDEAGRYRFVGYVVEFGPFTVYHSGDTVRYAGQSERLRHWSIDVALLPINGRAPERRVAGNLWGDEAAELARDIGARLVIPCHYDMFTFNTASPEPFETTCRKLGQDYAVLQCGQRWTSPAVK